MIKWVGLGLLFVLVSGLGQDMGICFYRQAGPEICLSLAHEHSYLDVRKPFQTFTIMEVATCICKWVVVEIGTKVVENGDL